MQKEFYAYFKKEYLDYQQDQRDWFYRKVPLEAIYKEEYQPKVIKAEDF